MLHHALASEIRLIVLDMCRGSWRSQKARIHTALTLLSHTMCYALQMLSENAELSGRLIDVALTSDNDTFEAAFSKDNSSGSSGNGLVTVPLGHWSQEAAQKRRQEAEEEVCCNRHLPLKEHAVIECSGSHYPQVSAFMKFLEESA